MRGLAVALSVAVKIVAATLPIYYIYPLAFRFAESWMRARDPLDGFGGGLVVAIGVLIAFVASSALATSNAGRQCMVRACAATALLVAASEVLVLSAWLTKIPSRSDGAETIATENYVKYPPIKAVWPLEDLARPVGFVVLIADIAITLVILRACAPRTPPSRDGVSTAGTSTATS